MPCLVHQGVSVALSLQGGERMEHKHELNGSPGFAPGALAAPKRHYLALPASCVGPAVAGTAGWQISSSRRASPAPCPPCGGERQRCLGRRRMTSPEQCPSFEGVAALPCPSGLFPLAAPCVPLTTCIPALRWGSLLG